LVPLANLLLAVGRPPWAGRIAAGWAGLRWDSGGLLVARAFWAASGLAFIPYICLVGWLR
jgi:hypothetical protein